MIHLHVWFLLSGRNINKGFHRGGPVLTCQDLEDADTKCGSQILFWWWCLLDWTRMWLPHMSRYLEQGSGDRSGQGSSCLSVDWDWALQHNVSHPLACLRPPATDGSKSLTRYLSSELWHDNILTKLWICPNGISLSGHITGVDT